MTTDGWVCVDGNEAAARVAHRLSEVVAITRSRRPHVQDRRRADPTVIQAAVRVWYATVKEG